MAAYTRPRRASTRSAIRQRVTSHCCRLGARSRSYSLRATDTYSESRSTDGNAFVVVSTDDFSWCTCSLSARWTALCAFLGIISYPLYVLHPPMLWSLTSPAAIHFANTHHSLAAPMMLVYAAALILLSWGAAQFYDTPVRKTLTRAYMRASMPTNVYEQIAASPTTTEEGSSPRDFSTHPGGRSG